MYDIFRYKIELVFVKKSELEDFELEYH